MVHFSCYCFLDFRARYVFKKLRTSVMSKSLSCRHVGEGHASRLSQRRHIPVALKTTDCWYWITLLQEMFFDFSNSLTPSDRLYWYHDTNAGGCLPDLDSFWLGDQSTCACSTVCEHTYCGLSATLKSCRGHRPLSLWLHPLHRPLTYCTDTCQNFSDDSAVVRKMQDGDDKERCLYCGQFFMCSKQNLQFNVAN